MSATIQIDSFHGSTPVPNSNISSIRFRRDDTDTQDYSSPIPIPSSGINYSWRKSIKANITISPSAQISNLRWYSDGIAWENGVVCYVCHYSNYIQASVSDNTTEISGSDLADSTIYTSASPLVINSGIVISNPNTGYGTQDYLIMQLSVDSDAVQGVQSSHSFFYTWDEI